MLYNIDTCHEDMIHDARLDFYGSKLATASSDCTIRVFEIRNGNQKQIAHLKGHEGPVWQISWAHPQFGILLASSSYDHQVIIWQEENQNWSIIHKHTVHDSSVNSISFAPPEYGLILACASSDGSISVLRQNDFKNWSYKKIDKAHNIGANAISWSPAIPLGALYDPSKIVSQDKIVKRFVTGGCDSLVKIWSEENDTFVEDEILEGHTDWIRDVAWAPSIGLSCQMIASCSQDKNVIIWKSEGQGLSWDSFILHSFDDVVWHVSWSVTGSMLAVSGGDNKVSLWKEANDERWICMSDEESKNSKDEKHK